jgi:hypothetical protein
LTHFSKKAKKSGEDVLYITENQVVSLTSGSNPFLLGGDSPSPSLVATNRAVDHYRLFWGLANAVEA